MFIIYAYQIQFHYKIFIILKYWILDYENISFFKEYNWQILFTNIEIKVMVNIQ